MRSYAVLYFVVSYFFPVEIPLCRFSWSLAPLTIALTKTVVLKQRRNLFLFLFFSLAAVNANAKIRRGVRLCM